MNKEFFNKALLRPICIAAALSVILCVFFKLNIDKFIPLYDNTVYAYHDVVAEGDSFKEDKNADPSSFEKNQCIGVIRAGEGYPIRYDMDYSNIKTSVSYLPRSVPFGKTGFTYIYSSNVNAKLIGKEKSFVIGSVFGEKEYKFKNEKSFNSEFRVLNYAPDCESAVIIYYRDSAQAGFTSNYIALVYEEVK